jgi:amino acid adenylation domain-containing protein
LPMLAAEPVAPMADFGPGETIHAMFERQVERAPDSVALTFEGEQVTYSVLNARANRLACRLMEGGVRPGTLVPVVMGRTPELIVSLLAVLKAGGAYVPIDPTYPPERIAFTLRDCGAALVLTDRCLADGLPQDGTRYVFASDPLTAYPDTNPASGATADHLAYVIYTSGSTGQPKGALIPHCNVWRLFAATDAWFGFGAADVWTLFHSAAFDFSVWEMWGALCYGGRLVIVPYAVSRDPQAFLRMLSEQRVTVLNQTPSAFRQLVAVDGQDPRPLTLRYVIFGGEALEFESLRPWFARHGDTAPQLVNMYGITETTVHVTYQPICVEDLDRHRGRSRIGCAIPDLRLHILDAYGLDAYGAPVPVGVAGELHVGGAGLARGYLNRPELTAERFFEHPEFGRLYKTGDLCRWLPDGNMEYLGRTDFQVKIRGFRVELGEIESALMSEPGVREAVALVREDQPGDQRIVAYVVGSFDGESDRESIRERLARRLPEYMVPSAFVRLESMPLTANGKLDRGALPVPDAASVPRVAYVEPQDGLEARIAAIWSRVLDLDQVGLYDNFFDLGGNSLLIIKVRDELREALQRNVAVVDLFRHPTVHELARYFQSEDRPKDDSASMQATEQTRADKQRAARMRRRQAAGQHVP